MIKSVKTATLITAMLFSAGVMAQSSSDVVTKPGSSDESKPPSGTSTKTRGEVRNEATTGTAGVLKRGSSDESRSPAADSMPSGKTRADVKAENRMGQKKGTTPDGMNEPDSAYPKTSDPKSKNMPAKTSDKY